MQVLRIASTCKRFLVDRFLRVLPDQGGVLGACIPLESSQGLEREEHTPASFRWVLKNKLCLDPQGKFRRISEFAHVDSNIIASRIFVRLIRGYAPKK